LIEPPPRDDAGQVIPHNHREINSDHEVIRRISEEQIIEKDGRRVISSMAYKASTSGNRGMSVDLKQFIESDGVDPKVWVTTPRWIGSVVFIVSKLREMDFMVGYDPIPPPDSNIYHGEVWGSFTGSKVKKLKLLATWFVSIKDVDVA
jgi:hypothetical protein